MRNGVRAIVLIAMLGTLVGAATAGRPSPGHTQLQAEQNIFRAVGVLRRWRTSFVDPRLNIVRSRTQVACTGVGPTRASRYRTFVCTMHYGSSRLRLRYTVHRRNGFGMHRLSLHPAARKKPRR